MCMNVSFSGLPQHLQRTSIYETNYKGVTEILKDAGQKAGVVINASAPKVLNANPDLFDNNGHVADTKAARSLINGYAQFIPKGRIDTCADFRDAVANTYKERLIEEPKQRQIDLISL